MNVPLVIGLLILCIVLMIIERMGFPTTLELSFRGDIDHLSAAVGTNMRKAFHEKLSTIKGH